MSQSEALLASLSAENDSNYISTYAAINGDNNQMLPEIIVGSDRVITVPEQYKRLAVQYDHNIETIVFAIPRYWDGVDMSSMKIRMVYMRPDGIIGSTEATNVEVYHETDEEQISFRWAVNRHTTAVNGNLKTQICVMNVDESGFIQNHWSTEINNDFYISEGMECEEGIAESYPDIFEQLLIRMKELELGYDDLTAVVEAYNNNVNTYDERLNTVEDSIRTLSEAVRNIKVDCDETLSKTSTNPVQNKIVTAAIENVQTSIGDIQTTIGDIQTALVNINTSLEETLGV